MVTIPVTATAADVRLSFTANSGAPGGQVAELQVLGTLAPNPDLDGHQRDHVAGEPARDRRGHHAQATVSNIGTASAAASTVNFYLGTTKVGSANVPALPRARPPRSRPTWEPQTAGTYATSAVVDEAHAIVETRARPTTA